MIRRGFGGKSRFEIDLKGGAKSNRQISGVSEEEVLEHKVKCEDANFRQTRLKLGFSLF